MSVSQLMGSLISENPFEVSSSHEGQTNLQGVKNDGNDSSVLQKRAERRASRKARKEASVALLTLKKQNVVDVASSTAARNNVLVTRAEAVELIREAMARQRKEEEAQIAARADLVERRAKKRQREALRNAMKKPPVKESVIRGLIPLSSVPRPDHPDVTVGEVRRFLCGRLGELLKTLEVTQRIETNPEAWKVLSYSNPYTFAPNVAKTADLIVVDDCPPPSRKPVSVFDFKWTRGSHRRITRQEIEPSVLFDSQPVTMFGVAVTKTVLESKQSLFTGHMSAYRALLKYCDNPRDFDVIRLQKTVDRVLDNKQVETHERESSSLSLDSFPSLSPPPERKGSVWDVAPKAVRESKADVLTTYSDANNRVVSFHLQGAAASKAASEPFARFAVSHTFNVDGRETSDPAEVVHSIIGQLKEVCGKQMARVALSVVSFLVSVSQARSWVGVASALGQFVLAHDITWNWVLKLVEQARTKLQGSEDDAWYIRLWRATFGALLSVLSDAVGPSVGDLFSLVSEKLSATLSKAVVHESAKRMAQSIVDGLTEAFRRFISCVETRSFSPLWGPGWDPAQWFRVSNVFLSEPQIVTDTSSNGSKRREVLIREGKLPEHYTVWKSVPEFITLLDEHIQLGKQLMKYYSSSMLLVAEFRHVLTGIEKYSRELIAREAGACQRQQPFFIVLYGPANAGKTVLSSLIADIIARDNGYPMNPGARYKWTMNANFQTGLDHHTYCVFMDDVDQSVAPDAAGMPNHVESLITLVNNAPFPVEESESQLKGKTFTYPSLVIMTTNRRDCNVRKRIRDENAFWRRVSIHARVTARSKYATTSGGLDAKAAELANTWDLYSIDVSTYDGDKWNAANPDELPFSKSRSMNVSEFMVMIKEKFRQHHERQARLMDILNSPDNTGFCNRCGLPIMKNKCACPVVAIDKNDVVVEPQGLPSIQFTSGAAALGVSAAAMAYSSHSLLYKFSDYYQRGVDHVESAYKEYVRNYVMEHIDKETWDKIQMGGVAALFSLLMATGVLVRYYQGRENNATGLLDTSWTRASQTQPAPFPVNPKATWTYDDVRLAVSSCIGTWESVQDMHCLSVAPGFILVPTHGIALGQPVTITVAERKYTTRITEFNVRSLSGHSQLSLVHVPEVYNPRSLVAYIAPVTDMSIQQYDEVQLITPKGMQTPSHNQIRRFGSNLDLTVDEMTKSGDCGLPYLTRFGTSWRITAIHYAAMTALLEGRTTSNGAIFDRAQISAAATDMGTIFQGSSVVRSSLPKEVDLSTITTFPAKSEFWTANSQQKPVGLGIGYLPGLTRGQTMKTKIIPSVLSEVSDETRTLWCGISSYWRLPHFGGFMKDGKWTSPYTEALSKTNDVIPDDYLLRIAIADYLQGADELDVVGYATLSETETITGVPGSYIKSVNLGTSIGPPHIGQKRAFVRKDGEDVYARAEIWDSFDETEELLKQGDVPCPMTQWTLKDETVKAGKMPRTFTVFPAGFNMSMKRRFSPIRSFIRANMLFFESFVGVNLTGPDAALVTNHLSKVDPSLARIIETDVSKMDLSLNGRIWHAYSRTMYALAKLIGVDAREVYALTVANREAVHCIKSDLFRLHRNASGGDDTININGICLAIGSRLAYYAMLRKHTHNFDRLFPREVFLEWDKNFLADPFPQSLRSLPFSFRKYVALATFGDDALMSYSRRIPFPDSVGVGNLAEVWLAEWGFVITDGQKEENICMRHISQVTFLKRGFVWDEEVGRFLTPLSKKSLARGLAFKKDSTLTVLDAAATTCSEILRELVYHGEDEYNKFKSLVEVWAKQFGFHENRYLVMQDYSHWRAKVLDGSFSAWEPVDPLSIL